MTTAPDNHPPEDTTSSHTLSRWKLSATPVPPPSVDRSLTQQDHLHRTVLVLQHALLRFEYWLSPNGLLREWCRRCLLLALFLAVPVLCFSPLFTVLLDHLTGWSGALLQICSNLAQIPGRISAGVLIALISGLLLRWLFRH